MEFYYYHGGECIKKLPGYLDTTYHMYCTSQPAGPDSQKTKNLCQKIPDYEFFWHRFFHSESTYIIRILGQIDRPEGDFNRGKTQNFISRIIPALEGQACLVWPLGKVKSMYILCCIENVSRYLCTVWREGETASTKYITRGRTIFCRTISSSLVEHSWVKCMVLGSNPD
jgi:hypothetical protein